MAQDFLATLLAGANSATSNFRDSIINAITGVNTGGAAQKASFANSLASNKLIAGATETVAATQNAAELQAQASMTSFSIAAEADIGDISGTQRRLAEEYNALEGVRSDKLAIIREKLSASPIEDPLAWLEAQLTVDPLIREHNVLEQEANARSRQLITLNQMIDSRYSAVQKLKESTSQAAAAAKTKIAVEVVNMQGEEIRRQEIAGDLQRVQAIANLSGAQAEAKSKLFSMQAQYEGILNNRAQLAQSMEMFKLNRDRILASNKDDAEKEALIAHDLAAVQRGMEIAGVDRQQIAAMDNINIRSMLKGVKKLDPEVERFYQMGLANLRAGYRSGAGIIANDPATASETVRMLNIQLPAAARDSLKLVTQARKSIPVETIQAMTAAKDFVGIERLVSAAAQKILDENQKRTGDPASTHYLPDVATIVQNIPGLAQTAGFKKVLAPILATGTVKLDSPKIVALHFQDAIRKGDVTFEEARSAMQAIYLQGQTLNFATKQLVRLGFTPKITYISEDVRGEQIDFADYNGVGKALMNIPRAGWDVVPYYVEPKGKQ